MEMKIINYRKSSNGIDKKNNKKNNQHKWNPIWIGFWYKLLESEEKFDNINKIEDSNDRMKIINYRNT